MQGLLEVSNSSPFNLNGHGPSAHKAEADTVILKSLDRNSKKDKQAFNKDLSEGLYITAQKVLARLNEVLAAKLPDGIESLNPEDHTSEKTATQIVSMVTSLFDAYAKSNPNKSDEELIDGFMKAARKGVEQGYGEAFDILQDIGAFKVPGVKSGVEKTKQLIEEKLSIFELHLKERFGLESSSPQNQISNEKSAPVLAEKTGYLLNLVA